MQTYKVTTLWSGLFQLVACLKCDQICSADLSSVRRICSYGSKMTLNFVNEINRYFPNANTTAWYGATEIGLVCQRFFESEGNNGTGQLIDDCTAKIINENGIKCGQNIDGELCVKKRYKFTGYIDDLQLTANAIDSEGFMKTGDIGYFDKNGTLFIKDRKKNSILNVFYFRGMVIPSEIEDYLTSLSDIEEACVVRISVTAGSDLPAAVIVKNLNSNLSQQEVFKVVAGKKLVLSLNNKYLLIYIFYLDNFPNRYKLRAGVYFVDSIPKTHTGKHIRGQATKLATQLFDKLKENDPVIKLFLSDIPEQFRKLI